LLDRRHPRRAQAPRAGREGQPPALPRGESRQGRGDTYLTANRFGFEPEVIARLAKRNARIYEVPISYSGRTYAEGKKIGWKDGVAAFWHIAKYNLFTK